jgi:hypothetical protein
MCVALPVLRFVETAMLIAEHKIFFREEVCASVADEREKM